MGLIINGYKFHGCKFVFIWICFHSLLKSSEKLKCMNVLTEQGHIICDPEIDSIHSIWLSAYQEADFFS